MFSGCLVWLNWLFNGFLSFIYSAFNFILRWFICIAKLVRYKIVAIWCSLASRTLLKPRVTRRSFIARLVCMCLHVASTAREKNIAEGCVWAWCTAPGHLLSHLWQILHLWRQRRIEINVKLTVYRPTITWICEWYSSNNYSLNLFTQKEDNSNFLIKNFQRKLSNIVHHKPPSKDGILRLNS